MTKHTILAVGMVFIAAGSINSAFAQGPATPTGAEIVGQCEVKNPGKDQRGRLTITLIDKGGNERKNVYLRLWKDYDGTDKVADKMVLFTEYPPDARGAAFLRRALELRPDLESASRCLQELRSCPAPTPPPARGRRRPPTR